MFTATICAAPRDRQVWRPDIIRKVLNHKEPGVTAIYDRYSYDNEKRDALEAWSRRLQVIVSGLREVVAD
jgi:hypothetical protein